MRITPEIKNKVREIVDEFCFNHKKFQESPEEFCRQQHNDGLILYTINTHQIIHDTTKIAVHQLYRSRAVDQKVRALARVIQQKANINCYASELINPLLNIFCKLINQCIQEDSSLDDLISLELPNEINSIRRDLIKKREFGFPYHMLGLTQGITLSNSISIELSQDNDLSDSDKEHYEFDRHLSFNAFIKIKIKEKISPKLGLDRAKKINSFVANFINFDCHFINHKGIPFSSCIASNAKIINTYDFYLVFNHKNEKRKSDTLRFLYNKADGENYWKNLLDCLCNDEYQKDREVILSLMTLALDFSKNRRVIDIIVNSINWYSDAFVEENKESQIVKCVTAIESLVNYGENTNSGKSQDLKLIDMIEATLNNKHEDAIENTINDINKLIESYRDKKVVFSKHNSDSGVTANFRLRVGKLYNEKDRASFESKAQEIYKARSQIVHGSGLTESLSFCPLKFCRETIYNAICYFYLFGLKRDDYKNKLPVYLEKIK